MSSPSPIAIIGAGVAGVACARRLKELGLAPEVFEKSRGVGGRLATRRGGDGLAFDHGAQFVTARSDAFRRALETAAVSPWHPRLRGPGPGTDAWLVGVPAMSRLVRPWTAQVPLHLRTRVTALARDGKGWRLQTADGGTPGPFGAVVLAVPAPQARNLAAGHAGWAAPLAAVAMAPCWTLMTAFASPLDAPFDAWRSRDHALAWACRNGSRPGRAPAPECWVVQAAPAWSEARLEAAPDTVAEAMTALLAELVAAPLPPLVYRAVHRWRYAMTTRPLGAPFLRGGDGTLYACGDWCLGARVEAAWSSGIAVAEALGAASRATPP